VKQEKIILGIDPGSRTTGFAVIKQMGRKLEYLDSGIIRFDKKEFLFRLGDIHQACEELIEKYHPDEVAFESLIYVKSPTALIKLAQARGAMVAAFMKREAILVAEYSPNLVKSTVVGHGHADKSAMQKGLGLIYGKSITSYKTHDESDALAIATCHALSGGKSFQGRGRSGSLKALGEQLLKEGRGV
jgi:crossover junction endodeoxyribonuclease RuvC